MLETACKRIETSESMRDRVGSMLVVQSLIEVDPISSIEEC